MQFYQYHAIPAALNCTFDDETRTHRPLSAHFDLDELLQAVRTEGDWEEWIEFFLEGIIAVASQAATTTRRLLALFQEHQRQVRGLGRITGSALRVMDHLQRHPVTTATAVAAATGMSFHTAQKMFAALQPLGITTEGSGRKYGRFHTYTSYLAILNEETQSPF